MLTRLAVATVFLCLVALLASACGWGGGYGGSPYVPSADFVLYQTAPGDPPRIIGYGKMGGSLATIYATVNLFNVSCAGPRPNQFNAQGSANAGFTTLASAPSEPVGLTLAGPVHSLPHGEWALTLPFSGTLTPRAPCAGAETLHIEARQGPGLRHHWQGRFTDLALPRDSVVLNLFQVQPAERIAGALWGELYFNRAPCARFGSFFLPVESTPASSSVRKFVMADRTLVDVTGLPSNLDPSAPYGLTLSLTFAGGPCDGQTFTAALTG